MNRGEVWWVNFEPSRGGEIKKTRPAIVVSNDASNRHLNRVQVVPITSNVSKLYPSEAYMQVLSKQAKAMADQIMTISKERLLKKMDRISNSDMTNLERVIKVQLGFK